MREVNLHVCQSFLLIVGMSNRLSNMSKSKHCYLDARLSSVLTFITLGMLWSYNSYWNSDFSLQFAVVQGGYAIEPCDFSAYQLLSLA